jgi:hypothetical protein
MPRAHKGEVVAHVAKDGRTYRTLRFFADGKRRRVPLGVVSAADAERALRHAMADVERGTWVAPEPVRAASVPTVSEGVPTFHEFAREWWALRKDDLGARVSMGGGVRDEGRR